MSFKYTNGLKVVFDHLRFSFNASNAVLMCGISVKYQYTIRVMCAHAYVLRKRPRCALIGAYALIRTNTVYTTLNPILFILQNWGMQGYMYLSYF